jgi:hypothetical protein
MYFAMTRWKMKIETRPTNVKGMGYSHSVYIYYGICMYVYIYMYVMFVHTYIIALEFSAINSGALASPIIKKI